MAQQGQSANGSRDTSGTRMQPYLCSKAELLAEHLETCLARGEIASPLPNIRRWAVELGVSHGTLEAALKILKRRGWIQTHPRRGIQIVHQKPVARSANQARLVRWITMGRQFSHLPTAAIVIDAISRRLGAHGIRVSLEVCDSKRLAAICDQTPASNELLLLQALPLAALRWFEKARGDVLMLDLPVAGLSLPYIAIDVVPAFRHATYYLVRRGFEHVTLVANTGSYPLEEVFSTICAQAPRPMHGQVVRVPDELYEQHTAIQRLAQRIGPRHGVICNSPVPVGAVMMALTQRGLSVPRDVEVIAVNAMPVEIRTVPIPPHYPYPLQRFARAVSQAVLHYFEQGAVPPLRQLIPLQLVEPSRGGV